MASFLTAKTRCDSYPNKFLRTLELATIYIMNDAPLSFPSLSTFTEPPIFWMIFLQMLKPRPVP